MTRHLVFWWAVKRLLRDVGTANCARYERTYPELPEY